MKILAIDASGVSASASILSDNKLLGEAFLDYRLTHSETLMPLIDFVVRSTETELKEIDYIACSSGPGSFTGLRIGGATAKGLALGLNKKIVPVPTLDVLAYNIFGTDKIICPIMDARRSQVYTAFYKWEGEGIKRLSDYLPKSIDEVILEALRFKEGVIFLGDGVLAYKDKILENKDFLIAPSNLRIQRASALAQASLSYIEKGLSVYGGDFELMYLRKSQAEREREEALKNRGINNDRN